MNRFTHCFEKIKKDYFSFCKKEEIKGEKFHNKKKMLISFLLTLSYWIIKRKKQNKKILFLGLSGGQGSGKTTITAILKIILTKYFKRKVCVISVDDFYKTLNDRNKMSHAIHPLLKTRGVPGTHDINLVKKFFDIIKKKKFTKIKLPKFEKAKDNRLKKKYWFNIKKKPEIVILEGWCVGAKPQSNSIINKSINVLEKYEDKHLIWRKYANEKLKKEYKKLFAMVDHFIFMKIPNFNVVLKWRLLQENKLKKKSHLQKEIMSYNEIKRFIMFYQRITLQMIKDLSKSASVFMLLKKNHEIKKVLFKS